MSEYYLIGIFILLTVWASTVIVYPLRRHLMLSLSVVVFIAVLASTGYFFWGSLASWQKYLHYEKKQLLVRQLLQTFKTPQELAAKLKEKLDDSPSSAKGWYLLGRLYSGQNKNQSAFGAFAKAYHLKPEVEQFAVHYAHSLWQKNHGQWNAQMLAIFHNLLNKNPKQADALAMLAMHAYQNHAYEKAISYWQRLLVLAPKQSEEALAIHKAIVKADKMRLR